LKSTNCSAPLAQSKHVTASGVFVTVCTNDSGVFVNAPLPVASLVVCNVDPTVMDRDQDEESKHATNSDVFTPFYTKRANTRCHSQILKFTFITLIINNIIIIIIIYNKNFTCSLQKWKRHPLEM
jgi:hypothetical protein